MAKNVEQDEIDIDIKCVQSNLEIGIDAAAETDSETEFHSEAESEDTSESDSDSESSEIEKYECQLKDSVCKNLYQTRKITGDIIFVVHCKQLRSFVDLLLLNSAKIVSDYRPLRLYAHKSILAAGSPKFEEFFDGRRCREEFHIADHNQHAFKLFIKSFYTDSMRIDYRDIYGIMELATDYDVPQCMEMCINAFRSYPLRMPILSNYKLAIKFEQPELNQIFENYIMAEAEMVLNSYDFKDLDVIMLERILRLDLRCEETVVFDACLDWARKKSNGKRLAERNGRMLRMILGNCIHLIRFHRMTMEELTERTVNDEGLFSAVELEDIIHSITIEGYKSKFFRQ